jgi:hypothetical protein
MDYFESQKRGGHVRSSVGAGSLRFSNVEAFTTELTENTKPALFAHQYCVPSMVEKRAGYEYVAKHKATVLHPWSVNEPAPTVVNVVFLENARGGL